MSRQTWLEQYRSSVSSRDFALLEKASSILERNTYAPNEYGWGPWRMVSPCRGYFKGFWNWDTAFIAEGMSRWDTTLAKEQILGFLSFQMEDGMLPDVKRENGELVDTLSKPPVLAPAAWTIFCRSGDLDFLREVYPKFVKNESFWTTKRCQDGLFYYSAVREKAKDEAEYLTWAGYESGWDNAVRWDMGIPNLWAIDLNCYMVMTYRSLKYMAVALGLPDREWAGKESALIDRIETTLWNDVLGAYVDVRRTDGQQSNVLSPASLMPLYIGTASLERAVRLEKMVREHLYPGMPTVAYDDPRYSDNYWRGPCWLNVAYFAAKGLKNYGFTFTADGIRDEILGWVERDGDCIHENYNARTGVAPEKHSCKYFSWSSVFVIEFILNF